MGDMSDEEREAREGQSVPDQDGGVPAGQGAAMESTQSAADQGGSPSHAGDELGRQGGIQGADPGSQPGATQDAGSQTGSPAPDPYGAGAGAQAGPGQRLSDDGGGQAAGSTPAAGSGAGLGQDAGGQTGGPAPGTDAADAGSQGRLGQGPGGDAGSPTPATYSPTTGSAAGPGQNAAPQTGAAAGPAGQMGGQAGAPGIPPAPIAAQPYPAPAALTNEPLGKRRNPIVVVLLSFITVGIYFLYWYGMINAEMRRHDPRIQVNPALAVLAQFVPIVNLISGYNTSERVRRLEIADGISHQISPVLSLLFMIFLGIGYPIQVQMHLNAQWDYHQMRPDPR